MRPEGYFDFKSVSEEEERLDFNRLKPCPHCKKSIANNATLCYFCGQEVFQQTRPSWIGWVAAALIIMVILSILLS